MVEERIACWESKLSKLYYITAKYSNLTAAPTALGFARGVYINSFGRDISMSPIR